MLLVAILLVPVVAGLVSGVVPWRPWVGWLNTSSVAAVLALGIVASLRTVHHGSLRALNGVLRIDALSAFMVLVIGAVALLATWQSVRYLTTEMAQGRCSVRRASLYGVLVQGFISAMLLTVLAANVGVMWVAIEATTIVTTFLVGHRNTRGSLEASWKYVIICSVGIAIAFLGTVLLYFATLHAGFGHATLEWTSLVAESHHLNPGVVRLAFALLVVGYGTKVGLAPMHSWLPDAHSQAPAPVSALMSGVLLSVAFYVLLRCKAVADSAIGPSFARGLLVTVGLLSLVVATSLLLHQRDYKRMLAYSSMEHVGLLALGAAAGTPLAIGAVLLHILGHGLAKGVLFLTSGELFELEGTSAIEPIRGLLLRRPVLGGLYAFALIALLGLPPFSLFVSELTMFRAEVQVGLGWVVAITLACLTLIFAAMATYGRHMLFGARDESEPVHATPAVVSSPLAIALVACGALGIVAWPLGSLLHAAAQVVVP